MANSDEAKKFLVAEKSKHQAAAYVIKGNYARAFAHYLVVLKLNPASAVDLREDFIFVLRELGILLENSKKIEELFKCYQQAIETLPLCEEIHNNFGAHLVRVGHPEEAAVYFFNALKLNPQFSAARNNLENVYNAVVERWHFSMLNDTKRNLAYQNAICSAVQNGWDTVLDIGSGTGLLSMFAVDAGAKEVFACEVSKTMYAVANEVLASNSMQKKIQMFNVHSSQLSTNSKFSRVKLVVTEIMDCGLLGEHILSTLHDAWQHLLVFPDSIQQEGKNCRGKVIPASATVWAVLLESKYVRQRNRLVHTKLGELDLKAFLQADISSSEPYFAEKVDSLPGGITFLSKPESILHLKFDDPQIIETYMCQSTSILKAMQCVQNGFLDGIAMWFDLCLDENNHICTSDNTCWEQAIFPVNSSCDLKVADGTIVDVQCSVDQNCLQLQCVSVGSNKLTCSKKNSSLEKLNTFSLSRQNLLLINSERYWSVINSALTELMRPGMTVWDTNDVPIGAFLSLKAKAARVALPDTFEKRLAQAICNDNNLNSLSIEYLKMPQQHDHCKDKAQEKMWDIIIVNPVESVGMLKQGYLEDIVLLRALLAPGGSFFPSHITVCALLVESQALLEMNRLIDDSRVTGYHIAEFINLFKASLHLDFYLSSTSHRRLSKEMELFTINIGEDSAGLGSQLSVSRSADGITTASGQVHAVVIWFKYHFTNCIALNTTDDSAMWKQAAFVLDSVATVHAQQPFTLKAIYDKTCLSVELMCK